MKISSCPEWGVGCGGGRVQEGCLKSVYPLKDEVHTLPSANPSTLWCWATWLHLIYFISSLCTDVTSLWNLLSENRPGHFLKPKGTQTQQRLISSVLPGLETESVLSPGAILSSLPWIWKGAAFSPVKVERSWKNHFTRGANLQALYASCLKE